MSDVAGELAAELGLSLLRLIPMGALLADHAPTSLREAVRMGLPKREVSLVQDLADEIGSSVRAQGGLGGGDPGVANQAALNLLETIRSSSLSLDTLLECDLDARKLAEHLITHYAPIDFEMASAKRRGMYTRAVQAFSTQLLASFLKFPGAQAHAMGAILQRQSRLEARLEALLSRLDANGGD